VRDARRLNKSRSKQMQHSQPSRQSSQYIAHHHSPAARPMTGLINKGKHVRLRYSRNVSRFVIARKNFGISRQIKRNGAQMRCVPLFRQVAFSTSFFLSGANQKQAAEAYSKGSRQRKCILSARDPAWKFAGDVEGFAKISMLIPANFPAPGAARTSCEWGGGPSR
jgi:hypothetical protein